MAQTSRGRPALGRINSSTSCNERFTESTLLGEKAT